MTLSKRLLARVDVLTRRREVNRVTRYEPVHRGQIEGPLPEWAVDLPTFMVGGVESVRVGDVVVPWAFHVFRRFPRSWDRPREKLAHVYKGHPDHREDWTP